MSAQKNTTDAKPSRLWLWVLAAFALQLTAWAAWFIVASRNNVEEVPLATAPIKK